MQHVGAGEQDARPASVRYFANGFGSLSNFCLHDAEQK
jgi:hypothetical protein